MKRVSDELARAKWQRHTLKRYVTGFDPLSSIEFLPLRNVGWQQPIFLVPHIWAGLVGQYGGAGEMSGVRRPWKVLVCVKVQGQSEKYSGEIHRWSLSDVPPSLLER